MEDVNVTQIFIWREKKELEHHAVQTVFHKLFVHSHELGDEGFQVVDGLAAQLQPVLVVGRHVSHLRLQLPVAVAQQLRDQTLSGHRTRRVRAPTAQRSPQSYAGGRVSTFIMTSGGMQCVSSSYSRARTSSNLGQRRLKPSVRDASH